MDILDDPTLSSAAALVGNSSSVDCSETGFLCRQLATIEAYVERFPSDERDERALAWIEANARRYRQRWQRQMAVRRRPAASTPGR